MSSSGSPVHGISGRGVSWQITVNTSQNSPRPTQRVKESFLHTPNLKMSDLMDRIGKIVKDNFEDPSMPPLNREFEVDPGFYCENAEEFTERKKEITQQYPQISITFGFGMGRTMIYVSRESVKTSPKSSPKRGASHTVYHINTQGSAGQTQSAPASPNPHSGASSPVSMTTGVLSVSRSISGTTSQNQSPDSSPSLPPSDMPPFPGGSLRASKTLSALPPLPPITNLKADRSSSNEDPR